MSVDVGQVGLFVSLVSCFDATESRQTERHSVTSVIKRGAVDVHGDYRSLLSLIQQLIQRR